MFNPVIIVAIIIQALVTKASRIAGAIIGFVITAGILVWGITVYGDGGEIALFGIPLSEPIFIILCLVWFGFDTREFLAARRGTTTPSQPQPGTSFAKPRAKISPIALFFLWLLTNIGADMLGGMSYALFNPLGDPSLYGFASVATRLFSGLIGGVFQWLLLTRVIPNANRRTLAAWIPISMIAWAIVPLVSMVITARSIGMAIFNTIFAGLVAGGMQWLILRKHSDTAYWWIAAWVVDLLSVGLLSLIRFDLNAYNIFLYSMLMTVIGSLATSVAIVFIFKKSLLGPQATAEIVTAQPYPARVAAPEPAASYADPVHQQSPAMGASRVSPLRLADPAHPARNQLAVAARIIDPYVRVELVGERTSMNFSAPAGEMPRALSSLDEAMRIVPEDMDLHVAKAGILHASAQFKSAEDELDYVLGKLPDHFEAKMWKTHWESWSDALRFPGWDEQQSMLHPVMAAHLRLNHLVQVVRDGLQKTLAIVTNVQGPPFDSRTQVKVEWILSNTPYGPLVAYYLQLTEPMGEPSTMEAFVPIFQPSLYSPMEGYFLMQQLAFTPYCFVVLASGNTVTLNRRLVFGPRSAQKIRDIAGQAASTQSYLSQPDFKSAMQWHMNNFDMDRLTFE